MKPSYKEYTIQELEDALESIDQSTFPERAEEIRKELQSSRAENTEKTQPQATEYNEEFYGCPSCKKRIGIFSKTLNKWGKLKACPHCNEPFKFQVSGKALAILFIPALVVHFLLFKPLFVSVGLTGGVSAGVVGGLTALLSMRLKTIRRNNGT